MKVCKSCCHFLIALPPYVFIILIMNVSKNWNCLEPMTFPLLPPLSAHAIYGWYLKAWRTVCPKSWAIRSILGFSNFWVLMIWETGPCKILAWRWSGFNVSSWSFKWAKIDCKCWVHVLKWDFDVQPIQGIFLMVSTSVQVRLCGTKKTLDNKLCLV